MTKGKVWPVNSYNLHEVQELQFSSIEWHQWVKCGGQGAQTPAPIWAPCKSAPPIESIKCYFMAKYNVKLVGCGMGMGFAPTLIRHVSAPPPVSHDHFNHCWMWIANRRLEVVSHHGGRDMGGGRGAMAPPIMWLGAMMYLAPHAHEFKILT